MLRTQIHSEPCWTSMMEPAMKIVNGIIIFINHNYFRNISFSPSLLYEINIISFFQYRSNFYSNSIYSMKKKYEGWGCQGPWIFTYTLYNSKFVKREMFIETMHLHLWQALFHFIKTFIKASMINPSCKYLGSANKTSCHKLWAFCRTFYAKEGW